MKADLFSESPAFILSHHADPEAADAFIAWRKQIKKPLTVRAAKMQAKILAAINAAGGCATEALDIAQLRGWQAIKEDWYFNDKNGNGGSKAGAAKGSTAVPDEARSRSLRAAEGFGKRSTCSF
ncbi:MAG: hypothetical protein Unbinned7865contig1001_19 [Prokaryotic dsDNA virus sp.]|nr:MAG: hypothetical protein Unbinned7865contig1001_19 [Prokaryotic dsDNA virus sp.]|tara:strand:- start:26453 stop:26824 length:372 start_codon:yes stop_codon:yes gene_type:complete